MLEAAAIRISRLGWCFSLDDFILELYWNSCCALADGFWFCLADYFRWSLNFFACFLASHLRSGLVRQTRFYCKRWLFVCFLLLLFISFRIYSWILLVWPFIILNSKHIDTLILAKIYIRMININTSFFASASALFLLRKFTISLNMNQFFLYNFRIYFFSLFLFFCIFFFFFVCKNNETTKHIHV